MRLKAHESARNKAAVNLFSVNVLSSSRKIMDELFAQDVNKTDRTKYSLTICFASMYV